MLLLKEELLLLIMTSAAPGSVELQVRWPFFNHQLKKNSLGFFFMPKYILIGELRRSLAETKEPQSGVNRMMS